MEDLLASLVRALNVTLPVCVLIFLGVMLKHRRSIDEAFISRASALVFHISIPMLIFFALLSADLTVINFSLLVYFSVATVLSFSASWLWACWRIPYHDRGAFTQGAFRGNGSILGIAFAGSMYGSYGVSMGALLVAALIPLYNGLSVILLSVYRGDGKIRASSILVGILKNPLIQAVIAAVFWRMLGLPMPTWIATAGHDLGGLALPMALLCIGGTLSMNSLRHTGKSLMEATLLKTVLLPLVMTLGAYFCGYRGADIGILFLYFASPTAAASFVMAYAMGANAQLAASIIAMTTLVSMITISIGLCLIQMYAG